MSTGYDPYNQPQGSAQPYPSQGYGQAASYGQGAGAYGQAAYADPAQGYPGYSTYGAGGVPGLPPFVSPTTAPSDVGFTDAVRLYFKKYAQFRGAASRSEYWYAMLGMFLVELIPTILLIAGLAVMAAGTTYDEYGYPVTTGSPVLLIIGYLLLFVVGLALFVPTLAITWRRLHDTGKSGVWYFIALVPMIGGLWLLILLVGERRAEMWRPEWFV